MLIMLSATAIGSLAVTAIYIIALIAIANIKEGE